eukprot:5637490-Pleurochrysis_carterae.AAC.2
MRTKQRTRGRGSAKFTCAPARASTRALSPEKHAEAGGGAQTDAASGKAKLKVLKANGFGAQSGLQIGKYARLCTSMNLLCMHAR